MSFLISMCWLKRNCSRTPSKLKLDKSDLEDVLKSNSIKSGNKKQKNKEKEAVIADDEDDIEKKYNLDDYDDENTDIRAEEINTLTCFATNTDDNYLTIKDEGEDSDEEDFEIKSNDNLLICGQVDKEVCTLNAYVYNEFDPCFYIHHDILLPSYPICVEWLDYDSTMEKTAESVNYLAIGTMNPWIEIWDLDVVDTLEPEFILAPEKQEKKSKKLNKTVRKINGHKDAVLDLSWNKLNRNVLASGSADKTIVLWDLDTLKQATKIKKHQDKIQTIKFHPIEAFSLLSGSFDQTVNLYDCRNPTENFKKWDCFDGEIEKVLWNHFSPNYFMATTDQGTIYVVDIRQDKPLASCQAHDSAASGLTISSSVPGLLVTASTDEIVKIWDVSTTASETLTLIDEKKLDIGPICCAQASPDSQFVFAFGGHGASEPHIWDVRSSKKVREHFYPRVNLDPTKEEEREEEEAEAKSRKRAKKFDENNKKLKKKKLKTLKKSIKAEKNIKEKKKLRKEKLKNK